MIKYNEVSRGIAKSWARATDKQKHGLVKIMFTCLAKDNIDQEEEYAILDFMDKFVFGTNVEVSTLGLKCERGFSHYKR
jgi:hypothetical protein